MGLGWRGRFPAGELFLDIKRHLPNLRVRTIFDVGANVGQSLKDFTRLYPDTEVHCFEPSPINFAKLAQTVATAKNARCYQIALGANEAVGTMVTADRATMHTVSPNAEGNIPVEITTLDKVMNKIGLNHVDYLKIDTEGFDLDVLRGATESLSASAFDLIEVECGMNKNNTYHVRFDIIKNFLEAYGYLIFRFYDQASEWPTGAPNLRRANVVFLSAPTIQRNTIGGQLR